MMMEFIPVSVSGPIRNLVKVLKTRPQDFFAYSFIWILSCLVYFYATYIIGPILFKESSSTVQFLMVFLLPKYILGGVLSNMVMFRRRDSSIRNKLLIQPVTRSPATEYSVVNGAGGDLRCQDIDNDLKERTKCMGEHFSATPFNDEKLWHICATCEIFVPPKAWHCNYCDTCILRRDHHCVFTMGCVGEENHCNFLGLLFYLCVGCSLSAIFACIYNIYFLETVWWMFLVKCFIPFYSIFYDFNMLNILSGIVLMGQISAWGIFCFYLYLAFRGQTSADWSKARALPPAQQKRKFSYENFENLLGPNPFLRIMNPFHKVILKSLLTQEDTKDSDNRKGL